MPPEPAPSTPGMTWLMFALMTVACWGVYGVFLHAGVMAFEPRTDPTARYKAFLFVGVAYFLTAVLAPLAILMMKGVTWEFLTNGKGLTWSLLAGTVGAAGAFFVLLAFGAKGKPSAVMSIIFAGAPIVNAIVALSWHPPAGGISAMRPQFYLGIVLAAIGGCLVTLYKDPAAPADDHAGEVKPTPMIAPAPASVGEADTDMNATHAP